MRFTTVPSLPGLRAGVGLAALALALPAAAQSQNAPEQQSPPTEQGTSASPAPATVTTTEPDGAPAGEPITVTGSRLRRDTYSSIEPVTVITKEEVTLSGFNGSVDALQSNEVTQGAAQINNAFGGFVTAGGTGANTLGLRNLGPARTLILLNGRRLAPSGTRGNTLSADLNVLPSAIVGSIEILKSGASSVYGSDAIAGVVNIITDTKLRGLTLEAQVNVPEIGTGIDRRVAASFGFGNDRLDIIGSVEWRKRDAIRLNDVDWTSCPRGGFLSGEGTEFGSGDINNFEGNPCFTLDNGGVTINTIGVPTRDAIGRTSGVLGRFNRLRPQPGQVAGTPGFLGVGTYDRDTFDPDSQKEYLITPTENLTGFLSATYDLEALGNAEIYGEVLGARRKSSAPLYRQLTLDYLTGSPLVPEIFRNGVFANPNETSSGQTVAARAFIGFGLTDSRQQLDYVRATAGIRGDFFSPKWRYDVSATRSWTDGRYEIESFLIDRVANSLLAVQNPDGTFRCASQATNANCVAAPVLNADTIGGRLPQAYRDYILQNTIGTTKFRETIVTGTISGDLFTLPGGDVQLVVGGEYRKQRIDDAPDPNAISGNLLGLTAAVPTRGSDNVKEAFTEVLIPVLRDRPFFENLTLNASGRYTDYASYGSDLTYKVAGEWEFFRGLGIRGSYGTSFRAPALAEQFLGATTGFIAGGFDPCDSDNFPANPANYTPDDVRTAANCRSVGIDVANFVQTNGITVFNRGGAETGLEAETSRNWTVGAVFQPQLGSGLSLALSADYFDIKVSNGVESLGGATILDRCYSAEDFDPTQSFCAFVGRNSNNQLQVTSGFINLSENIVKGYEFNARVGFDLFGGRMLLNANAVKYTEQSDRLFPEEVLLDRNGITGTPDFVGSFDATYRKGPVTLRYGFTFLDASSGTYDYYATSRLDGTIDPATLQDLRDNYKLEVPAYFLHNASVQFNAAERLQLTVGVRNIFDTEPPRVSAYDTTIANAPLVSLYDFQGRTFFVNTTVQF
ncbi:MAG: TonB-dependent receptor domain-containing protein [Erythrobacter sp.]